MKPHYDHVQAEARMYELWDKANAFYAPTSVEPDRAVFSIIMPPPNANDPLHMGHALFLAIQDTFCRFERMKGKAVLWLPGTDHAGIETQFVFEKKLKKKGSSRFHFDRETLYQMIWDYVQDNSEVAVTQMKRLGAGADWSRLQFTLDSKNVEQVITTFTRLHEDGLIERRYDLVHYCTGCGTAYSQLEVEYREQQSPLYTLAYGPFRVATVRPETLFGDMAVAVHPTDKRYTQFHNTEVEIKFPWGHRRLPVFTDEAVDPEFGTGVLKITPGHDMTDRDIWLRHGRDMDEALRVIDYQGRMTEEAGDFAGLGVIKARAAVVQVLDDAGLIIQVDPSYSHSVGSCYRCKRTIEPLPLAQFFIHTRPLVEPVLDGMKNGDTIIYGSGHDKILSHWLTNLKDWNISRQIVWGIRMPVWYRILDGKGALYEPSGTILVGYRNEKGEFVTETIKSVLEKYDFEWIEERVQFVQAPIDVDYTISPTQPGRYYLQETDTFDTWFSSSQWPVITLKSSGGSDFDLYYPTSLMETGYDILPFWVMRMMLMGYYLTQKTPFTEVYLHGLVRDEKGQKMSKSKGNVINPVDVADQFGADALRMSLLKSTTAGQDSTTGTDKIRGMRNFANKIWNAGRYVRSTSESPIQDNLENDDEMQRIVVEVTDLLDKRMIGLAAEKVYYHFWHWYCDAVIEEHKLEKVSTPLLWSRLETFLKLLHPFMPFVTEAVWQELFQDDTLLTLTDWPQNT